MRVLAKAIAINFSKKTDFDSKNYHKSDKLAYL